MKMDRRAFLQFAAVASLGAEPDRQRPEFRTANSLWQAAYDRALAVLAANVQVLPRYSKPILIEGANYAGIWLECGPHEALAYRKFRPDVARNSHLIFFALQRPDGQLPANNKVSETGFGQIQMVVPIAATAWELVRSTGDDELLHTAYRACSAWDDWLIKYRNTRGTGLVEGFCTYDTGHDNSPRRARYSATRLEHFHKYCGAGWYPAADWQSAWPAERNRAGRLPIGRRLTNLPHSNCENALIEI
jgi:hypothetical protein